MFEDKFFVSLNTFMVSLNISPLFCEYLSCLVLRFHDWRMICLNRVKDVVASMTKARGKRGMREISDQKYELTLQEKFKQVFSGTPEWADLDRKLKEESDDEDAIIRVSSVLVFCVALVFYVFLNCMWFISIKTGCVDHFLLWWLPPTLAGGQHWN